MLACMVGSCIDGGGHLPFEAGVGVGVDGGGGQLAIVALATANTTRLMARNSATEAMRAIAVMSSNSCLTTSSKQSD